MICLDSSVLIAYFRKKQKDQTLYAKLIESKIKLYTTAITTFEIYCGSEAAQIPFWDIIFERMPVLKFDEDASKIAANLQRQLKSKNKLIGLPDLYIASIAISNNLPLATHNQKDFSRVPGLQLYTE